MRIHPALLPLALAALLLPAAARAQQSRGYRFSYNYWPGGTAEGLKIKPLPSTVEFLGNLVRAEIPGEVFVVNAKNGELLHIDQKAKTFGYAQLKAYMEKSRTVSTAASTVVDLLPEDVKKLAQRQVQAKGMDPLLWTQTTRRAEAAGMKCAFVEGKIAAQVVRSVCSVKTLPAEAAPAIAGLEEVVADGTEGQRLTGVFGRFPWPLDFPFSVYGYPAVIEQPPVPGTPVRKFYELVSHGPETLSSDSFRTPPGYKQVDLFAGR